MNQQTDAETMNYSALTSSFDPNRKPAPSQKEVMHAQFRQNARSVLRGAVDHLENMKTWPHTGANRALSIRIAQTRVDRAVEAARDAGIDLATEFPEVKP